MVDLPGDKSEKERDVYTQAVRLASISALPMAVQTAVDVGVFDILAEAGSGLSLQDIVSRLGTANPEAPEMLERLLRVLCMHEVIKSTNGFYSLTPVCEYFTRNENGVSLAPLMRLNHDRVVLDSWSRLKDAILEGGTPFYRAHGMQVFEYLGQDGRFNQVYNTAMFHHTTIVVNNMLESYKGFTGIKTLVDVGGGIGVALSLITSKYRSIKGINFDLPQVIEHAPPFLGVKHVAGDMFKSVPEGDAIFMKGMLRDWSDDQCLKFLKNCFNALPENGKVIVVEQILPSLAPVGLFKEIVLNDVLAMTVGAGGKLRNIPEISQLGIKAGFNDAITMNLQYYHVVLEFHKSWSFSD